VHNPQNAVGNVANYSMQFIVGANRHQTLSGTLDALEAAENPVRRLDSFVATGNAKTQRRLQCALRSAVEKGKNKNATIIAACNDSSRQYLRW